MTQDEFNAPLPEEFHTRNRIPTDPRTHSLFFVSRNWAVLTWLFGMLGGGFFMSGVLAHHTWMGVLGYLLVMSSQFTLKSGLKGVQ